MSAGTPASTVFVGNLAYELTEQQLTDYFSQVGPVRSIRIVTERETGKPRGFGFIEFFDIPTAESAIRNLNGAELMGRAIRIVFAEGGPPDRGGGGDFRPRRDDDRDRGFGDDRGRRPPQRTRLVGADLAYHASHGVAALLGTPSAPGAPADAITATLARKTRSELWEYLAQTKALAQADPGQARQLLVQNPALTKALFQMEVILGLVGNPLGDVAPKGVAPPDLLPRGVPINAPPQFGGPLPGPGVGVGGPPPGALQQPAMVGLVEQQQLQPGMMQGPQQQMQAVQFLTPQQPAPGGIPMGPPGAPNGMQLQPGFVPGGPAQVLQAPQGGYILAQPPQQQQQQPMPGFQGAAVDPRMAAGPVDPRMAAGPVDPRARAGQAPVGPAVPVAAPGPMMPMAGAPPQQQPLAQQQPLPQQQPGAPAMVQQQPAQNITPEMQQALLQQVMSLTPQQIELLPPQQKAQVLALQQQMRQGNI